MAGRKVKLPVAVVERAKAVVSKAGKKPQPTPAPSRRKPTPVRAKVVAALEKLHPMD
jgi:hypothetical protein